MTKFFNYCDHIVNDAACYEKVCQSNTYHAAKKTKRRIDRFILKKPLYITIQELFNVCVQAYYCCG